jgi:hypothetical protein
LKSILDFKDVNGDNIFRFIKIISNIDVEKYHKNEQLFNYLLNKIKEDNINTSQFKKKLDCFLLLQQQYIAHFGKFNIRDDAYDYTKLEQLLVNMEKADNDEKIFILETFLKKDKIVEKKPFFAKKNKSEAISKEVFVSLIKDAIENKVVFISNNDKIIDLINQNLDIQNYIIYHD